MCPFSGLSVSSPAGKGDHVNHAAVGKLLGKTLLDKRKILFSYLLVVLISPEVTFLLLGSSIVS